MEPSLPTKEKDPGKESAQNILRCLMEQAAQFRTAGAVVAAIVAVAAVAVATRDDSLVGIVAGFAGTALAVLTQRHTSQDLAASAPVKAPSTVTPDTKEPSP